MSDHGFRALFLAVLLLLAIGSPVFALDWRTGSLRCRVCPVYPAAYAAGSPIVWADVWNIGHFLSSGGRTRIIQICVVVMCIALFIMMKKLNG